MSRHDMSSQQNTSRLYGHLKCPWPGLLVPSAMAYQRPPPSRQHHSNSSSHRHIILLFLRHKRLQLSVN
ncbi:unnamed protein product [Fusarium graminearum]|uniref:Uncharacterized protein n=1 Tax=Gibberella zeae TaxID=5518 RepID=A0A4U9EXS9_GIBZA|nr:unnamed protein product [Fusarium graminearum]CAF3465451.1 unnamed protein product [Fusarium graminearum]CAF3608677.1 unnamed protein product [Fusarium graminearum]CAG1964998.1 unnamed protein product [Fusarium graminearum]CAG1979745.1 unnamed protein product [Fusarium graminearum]